MRIHRIDRVTNEPYLNLFKAFITDRSGSKRAWIVASRKDELPLAADDVDSPPDGVIIVPVHKDAEHRRKLVMIEEFRVPIRDYEVGFPAGLIDGDESIEKTARRELKEETGLSLTHITGQSPPVYSSAGMTDESASIVFVECKGKLSKKHLEGTEEITAMLLDYAEMTRLFGSGAKFGAKAWLIVNNIFQRGYI